MKNYSGNTGGREREGTAGGNDREEDKDSEGRGDRRREGEGERERILLPGYVKEVRRHTRFVSTDCQGERAYMCTRGDMDESYPGRWLLRKRKREREGGKGEDERGRGRGFFRSTRDRWYARFTRQLL